VSVEAGSHRNPCDQLHPWTSVCFGAPGEICLIIRVARPARLGAHYPWASIRFRKLPRAAPQLLARESRL